MAKIPLPPSGSFINSVRSSCEQCRVMSKIEVPPEKVDDFLRNLDQATYDRLKEAHGLSGMPLRFSSPADELNVVSVMSILNFMHCYRLPLHKRTGRGAWKMIRYFVLSAYLASADGSTSLLSANGMVKATIPQVADAMGMRLHTERAHPTLPMTIGEVDPEVEEIVGKLAGVLNETGKVLQQGGYPDLGHFVAEACKDGKGDPEVLVERLVRAFPAFQDAYLINGLPTYLFKKALFLVQAISQTFSAPGKSAPFPIPDASKLPIFSDNVIPTMMVHFGLVNLDWSSDPFLSRGLPPSIGTTVISSEGNQLVPGSNLPPPPQEPFRAAAVAACEIMVKRAKEISKEEGKAWLGDMTVVGLDAYLWAVAKDSKELREVPRLTEMGTVMY